MCTISQNTSERRRPLLRNLHTCASFNDFLNQLHNMEPRGVPGLYELFQKDFPTDLKRAELSWIKVMSSPCAKFKCNKKINHQECFLLRLYQAVSTNHFVFPLSPITEKKEPVVHYLPAEVLSTLILC